MYALAAAVCVLCVHLVRKARRRGVVPSIAAQLVQALRPESRAHYPRNREGQGRP